jgi:hypothetical protein
MASNAARTQLSIAEPSARRDRLSSEPRAGDEPVSLDILLMNGAPEPLKLDSLPAPLIVRR